jgi:hypothetical protein
MFKTFLAVILLIHGIIHLLGFAKVFHLGNIRQLTHDISKPAGILWLLAFLLFIAAFILWLMHIDKWTWVCITAIGLSQLLIFFAWQDAKAGSLANLILLLVAWQQNSSMHFQNMIREERRAIITTTVPVLTQQTIAEGDLKSLPPMVQQWLRHSGVVGKPLVTTVRLKQTGKMKLKPGSNWMDFTATQYFQTQKPAFVWSTRVSMMPLVFFDGRDKFENGTGSMQIKLLSLIHLINENNTPPLNSGTALRYLGEISWFPSAALNDYVSWEKVDSLRAKATLKLGTQTVEGLFTFAHNGELLAFEAERFYGSGNDATKERWLITHTGYKDFDGTRIPYRSTVTWKLKEGDFNWLQVEITSLELNKDGLFEE